jgi:hypothetical protein
MYFKVVMKNVKIYIRTKYEVLENDFKHLIFTLILFVNKTTSSGIIKILHKFFG